MSLKSYTPQCISSKPRDAPTWDTFMMEILQLHRWQLALLHACDVTLALVTLQRGPLWLQASVGIPPGNRWQLQRANEEHSRRELLTDRLLRTEGPERARRLSWGLRVVLLYSSGCWWQEVAHCGSCELGEAGCCVDSSCLLLADHSAQLPWFIEVRLGGGTEEAQEGRGK